MKLTIKNDGRKINLKELESELGKAFRVTQEPHTLSLPDGVKYFDLEIEVEDDAKVTSKDLQKICDKHAPEMTEHEEAQAKKQSEEFEKLRPQIEIALSGLLSNPDFIKRLKKALEI